MSLKAISYKDYVAGWLDSSIHDFLDSLSPTAEDLKYALITCLDSNTTPASLLGKSPELKAIAKDSSVLGTGLLIPAKWLLEARSRTQIFFGFDEMWFFPHKPIEPKPASAFLVGPTRIDRGHLKQLGKWMAHNSCSLGLGDGEGLNFAVPAQGLVRYWIAHSIDRPEPILQAGQ